MFTVICTLVYFIVAGATVGLVRSQVKDKDDPGPFLVGLLWPGGLPLWLAWHYTEAFMTGRAAREALKKAEVDKKVDAASYRSVE